MDFFKLRTNYDPISSIATFKINPTHLVDAGRYIAVAENEAGHADTYATLVINKESAIEKTPIVNPDAFRYLEKKPQLQHPEARPEPSRREDDSELQPPKIIVPLSNAKFKEGAQVVLACKITGAPKPKVKSNLKIF